MVRVLVLDIRIFFASPHNSSSGNTLLLSLKKKKKDGTNFYYPRSDASWFSRVGRGIDNLITVFRVHSGKQKGNGQATR